MKRLVLFLAALLLTLPLWAQAGRVCSECKLPAKEGYTLPDGRWVCSRDIERVLPKCAVCGKTIRGTYKVLGMDRTPVCMDCFQQYDPCFVCRVPVREGGRKLSDGRVLCAEHRKTGVFTDGQTHRVYRKAKSEILKVFGREMQLETEVASVKLVDQNEMRELASSEKNVPLGLTQVGAIIVGGVRVHHPPRIYLLNGLPKEDLQTVCIHEYAHAWHSQRHPYYEKTSRRFKEGFAEWFAYRVTQERGRHEVAEHFLHKSDPDYVEGLKLFLKLEEQRGRKAVFEYALNAMEI